nr:hypothetical protein [Tanacetum cinerariifolium]
MELTEVSFTIGVASCVRVRTHLGLVFNGGLEGGMVAVIEVGGGGGGDGSVAMGFVMGMMAVVEVVGYGGGLGALRWCLEGRVEVQLGGLPCCGGELWRGFGGGGELRWGVGDGGELRWGVGSCGELR